ncbi:MAG TPA: DUF4232 domain-containing protein [Solirubrobacterales bacterium]|nr:DUF4232 domain-containing protein [Solirubrobacterales bacterium]
MLKSLCGAALIAVLSLMVLAGCGSGAGGSGATEAGTIPGTPPEEPAPPPAPRKPAHHRGPILAGQVRTLPGSSGEGAWAAGRSIYLTANGGRTWRAAAPVDVHSFVGSDFVDPEHGWVVASTSERHAHLAIYSTTDGGFTWTQGVVRKARQPPLFTAPLSFPNLRTGYVVVDPQHGSGVEAEGSLYRTDDGGAHWSPVGSTPVDGRIEFTSPRSGWLVGGLHSTLWHTADGGRHWTQVRVPAPRGDDHPLRYGLPTRLIGGLEVVPVLLEGSQTRIGFYERSPEGWRPAYVDTLVGTIGGGFAGVTDRPPDGFVVSDPGVHALKLIRFEADGKASARVLPARGMPAGATVHFADARHGFATPCDSCEHPGTQPYFTADGGRTWVRRPIRLRRSAALEALPGCPPGKLLVYNRGEGGPALGSVYTSLTIENLSGHTCKYSGTPRAIAVGVGGRTIGHEAEHAPNLTPTKGHPYRTIILTPDDTATARLSYGEAYNFPAKSCRPVTAAGLLVTLPGARRPQRVAMPFERCSSPRRGPGMIVGRFE